MTKDQQSTILITGGAGYVGSHCVLSLLEQNYRVVVIDNCSSIPTSECIDSNGNAQQTPESLHRVERLAGRQLTAFYKLDLVTDKHLLDDVFRQHPIRAVVHFAALKSVSESIGLPLEYYNNNLVGTINLLNVMKLHGCKRFIFSSSATVYGSPQYLPVDERHQAGLNILNPYGRTKYMIELVLEDLCTSSKDQAGLSSWSIVSLRYFNPVGAHPSGFIGEHTQGVPNNLMPYVTQVAVGKREKLFVFGDDFNTVDGTGVRDYIHIMDLASGHIKALDYLLREDAQQKGRYRVFNLGTGKGYSVLEIIKTFEKVNGVKVPYQIVGRREGDAAEVYADATLALKEMGWQAKHTLVEMVRDAWKWQSSYPEGFKSSA